MTYNENTDKIRIVEDVARHINMQTFPTDISWGSIPCLTHKECAPPGGKCLRWDGSDEGTPMDSS